MMYPERQYETNSWLCMVHEFTTYNEIQRIEIQADILHVLALYLDAHYMRKPQFRDILLTPGEYSSRTSRFLGKCLLDAEQSILNQRILDLPQEFPELTIQGRTELREYTTSHVEPILQTVQSLGNFSFHSGGMIVLPGQPQLNPRVR